LLPVVLLPAGAASETAWSSIWRGFREEMRSRSIPVLLGSRGAEEQSLIVLGIGGANRRATAIELAVEALRRRIKQHTGSADGAVIAVGPTAEGWGQLVDCLRRAIDVATVAIDGPPRPWHDAGTTNLDTLMLRLRSDDRLQEFATSRLAPLVEHDRRRAATLMPTLRALVGQGWRKSEAARVLNLNRQSLYPRLERIEQLLGVDLECQDDRLALELSLRIQDSPGPSDV
jgi:purine catabolism regulator